MCYAKKSHQNRKIFAPKAEPQESSSSIYERKKAEGDLKNSRKTDLLI